MLCTVAFNTPVWGVEYCDERVCLCVSVCLPESISPGKRPIFTIFVHVTHGRGSVLWRRCDTLCTSGFYG